MGGSEGGGREGGREREGEEGRGGGREGGREGGSEGGEREARDILETVPHIMYSSRPGPWLGARVEAVIIMYVYITHSMIDSKLHFC